MQWNVGAAFCIWICRLDVPNVVTVYCWYLVKGRVATYHQKTNHEIWHVKTETFIWSWSCEVSWDLFDGDWAEFHVNVLVFILGPKTVFFWAPIFKWVSFWKSLCIFTLAPQYRQPIGHGRGKKKSHHPVKRALPPPQGLVVAGLADMTRPAEKLSTSQSAVLTATGKKWFHQFIHQFPDQLKGEMLFPPLSFDFILELVFYLKRGIKNICTLNVTMNLLIHLYQVTHLKFRFHW